MLPGSLRESVGIMDRGGKEKQVVACFSCFPFLLVVKIVRKETRNTLSRDRGEELYSDGHI